MTISLQPASAQNITANGQTITLPSQQYSQLLTSTGAYTGLILTAGSTDGQLLILINNGGNALTFAAAGTSNVADGVSAVIPANRLMFLQWSQAASLWFRA